MPRTDGRGEPALPEPAQVRQGVARAGDHDRGRVLERLHGVGPAHSHGGFGRERVEVIEVREVAQPHCGDHEVARPRGPQAHGILLRQPMSRVGYHADGRDAGPQLQVVVEGESYRSR